MRSLGFWVVVAALASACGGHSRGADEGEAGVGPSSVAGSGGVIAVDMGGRGEPDACAPDELAAICANHSCPQSPDQVKPACGEPFNTTTWAQTECGGSVVVRGNGFGSDSWYFDAQGKLTGAIIATDIAFSCADGSIQSARTYGSVCAASGAVQDLCPPPCEAQATCEEVMRGTNTPACPATLQDFASRCSGGGYQVEQARSSCGGTVIVVTTQIVRGQLTFDARGNLSGALSTDDVGQRKCWGETCELEGDTSDHCASGTGTGP